MKTAQLLSTLALLWLTGIVSAQTSGNPPEEKAKAIRILGTVVAPGETRRLAWSSGENFAGIAVDTPVLLAHGKKPGPVLCLTSAVHGDELNGIEMIRRVFFGLEVEKLSGSVIGVPIVNLHGFQRGSRYLPDRRDLNRYFPGNSEGSAASRIAHSFFTRIVRHCDALVDLHTGSFHRSNLPQLRADLTNEAVLKLSQGFGATSVLKDAGAVGTLRRAATDAGIPAVTLEAGEPMRLQIKDVEHGVKAIRTLLNQMGMVKRASLWKEPQPVFYESIWVRANHGGILLSQVRLGDQVNAGDTLGTVTDPITNVQSAIVVPANGRILGMALNQVVMPGFAAFHVGIRKTVEEVEIEAAQEPDDDDIDKADQSDEAGDEARDEVIDPDEVDGRPE